MKEHSKEERKRLLIEMMKEDEKNGMYGHPDDEVIARFMGGSFEQREIMTYGGRRNGKWIFADGRWCYDDQLDYGVSWDRLMPVVRKIIQLTSATNIGLIDIKHRLEAVKKTGVIQNNLKFADINSVYSSVVGFIQWYNTQQHERK